MKTLQRYFTLLGLFSWRGMAWRSHGKDNPDLVGALKRNDVLTSQHVEDAMLKVDRKHYSARSPYMDSPQSIGYSVTISAPHMHVHALQHLEGHLQPGELKDFSQCLFT